MNCSRGKVSPQCVRTKCAREFWARTTRLLQILALRIYSSLLTQYAERGTNRHTYVALWTHAMMQHETCLCSTLDVPSCTEANASRCHSRHHSTDHLQELLFAAVHGSSCFGHYRPT